MFWVHTIYQTLSKNVRFISDQNKEGPQRALAPPVNFTSHFLLLMVGVLRSPIPQRCGETHGGKLAKDLAHGTHAITLVLLAIVEAERVS